MRAFDVYLNQKRLCRAGIGDDGVLTTTINWVAGKGRADLFLQVGGLVSPQDEFVNWVGQKRLRVGDRIQIEVVDVKLVDEPTSRKRRDRNTELKAKKRYVRMTAKELGWKIQSKRK